MICLLVIQVNQKVHDMFDGETGKLEGMGCV